MNQGEKRFYQGMRKAIGHKCHLSRIENVAGSGMPDLNIGYRKNDYWVELKHVEYRRFPITIGWRPHQISFAMNRNRHGSQVYLFVRFVDLSKSVKSISHFLFPTGGLLEQTLKNNHKLCFKSYKEMVDKSIFHTTMNRKPDWDMFLSVLHIQTLPV